MKHERERERMQSPGNGRFFDGKLFCNSRGNLKSIGSLDYIRNYVTLKDRNPSFDDYNNEINSFLYRKYNLKPNNSCAGHFISPLVFFDLVRKINGKFHLTTASNSFLRNYDNRNEKACIHIIIEKLWEVKYPNVATRMVENVNSFKYRILFHYMFEDDYVSLDFLQNKFPYINRRDDFKTNIEELVSGPKYVKFNSWEIGSLCALGILVRGPENKVGININYIDFIRNLFSSDNIDDLFHNESTSMYHRKQIVRDYTLRSIVLEKYQYRDCITGLIHVKLDKDGNPLCKMHHIIPMEYYNYYIDKGIDIDCKENAICVSSDTHDTLHHACDADRKEELLIAYDYLSTELKRAVSIEEYFDCYKFNYKQHLTNDN